MAQEAGRLYEEIAKENPGTVAENMAANCLGQQGKFLCDLGANDMATQILHIGVAAAVAIETGQRIVRTRH
jgi:hypothetical protein